VDKVDIYGDFFKSMSFSLSHSNPEAYGLPPRVQGIQPTNQKFGPTPENLYGSGARNEGF
jgi:hypothetical protein